MVSAAADQPVAEKNLFFKQNMKDSSRNNNIGPRSSSVQTSDPWRFPSAFTFIELLVVMAIIAALAAMLFPTIRSSLVKSRDYKAQVEVSAIEVALKGLFNEYNKWPDFYAMPGLTNSTPLENTQGGIPMKSDLVNILQGRNTSDVLVHNPRLRRFMEFSERSINAQGQFVDPWGNPYKFMVVYNYDNILTVTYSAGLSTNLYRSVAVWSMGPDEANSTLTELEDDVISW